MSFSNREIAAAIWFAFFIVGMLFYRDVRACFWPLIRAVFQPILIKITVIMGLYVAVCVAILGHQGLWAATNLKTTILWFLTFALLTSGKLTSAKRKGDFLGDALKETVAVAVFVEFLIGNYSFNLLAELVLVPVVLLVAMTATVATYKPEHVSAKKLLDGILALVGISYLSYAAYQVTTNFSAFATLDNAREFLAPIILSFMFFPFLYTFSVYLEYEQVFLGIDWRIDDRKLRRYAKWKAMLNFRTDTDFLERWRRKVVREWPQDHTAMQAVFAELKARKAIEANPPEISSSRGWCPFKAGRFLEPEGLQMNDYHFVYNRWQATSENLRLKRSLFDGTIRYYVYGDEEAATELALVLDMMSMEDAEGADAEFLRLALPLMRVALGDDVAGRVTAMLGEEDPKDEVNSAEMGYWNIALSYKIEEYQMGNGYRRRLTITCRGQDKVIEARRSE